MGKVYLGEPPDSVIRYADKRYYKHTCEAMSVDVSSCYDVCQTKGATIPEQKTSGNLSTCIQSIPTGIEPSGSVTIQENGTYDVKNVASAIVNVEGGEGGNLSANQILIECLDGDWDKFVKTLEDYPTYSAQLPAVGSLINESTFKGLSLPIEYKINSNGSSIDTDWVILAYNGAIPEYVKYRRVDGDRYERIYLRSLDSNGILRETKSGTSASDVNLYVGTETYTKNDEGTYSQTAYTVTSVTGSFFYGNNMKHYVPTSITVNGKTYDFCGYNVQLQSKYGLNWDGTNTHVFNPGGTSSNYNRWSTSNMKTFLNTDIVSRLTDTNFKKNVSNTVNRTWVYGTADTLDYTSDTLWLLGIGNINVTGKESGGQEYFKDQYYDTSIFDQVFQHRDPIWKEEDEPRYRTKFLMDSSGKPQSYTNYWWLRSAYSHVSTSVAYVGSYGYVDSNLYSDGTGVVPALTIG